MTAAAAVQPSLRPGSLEVRGIEKRFPGVRALRGVDLAVGSGEVVALIGENGAGKSTLMKILAGLLVPNAGEVLVGGRPVELASVRDAESLGIVLIHQEISLCDNLTVAGAIMLGREPRRGAFIAHRQVRAAAQRALDRLGFAVDPATPVEALAIGQQQLVEVARAISLEARFLIMDEPTSSLSEQETRRLFDVVRELRSEGVGVIYISHRLGEVKELADRVVVLRDGENAGRLARDEIDHDAMVRLMVGRDIEQFYPNREREPGAELLSVEGLRTAAYPAASNDFAVRAGEVVGIAGLVGAGRSEILRALFGVDPPLAGRVAIAGRTLASSDPRSAILAGMALVPEDRKQQGLVLDMAVRENLGLADLGRSARRGFLNRAREAEVSSAMIERLRIRVAGERQLARNLSGGNQQKVVLGKWLALDPSVLLLDEPTRGVDVGSKEEIYQLIERLAARGVAIVFASSEMEEVLGLADRVLVVHAGRITGELARRDATEERIMQLATGRAAGAAL